MGGFVIRKIKQAELNALQAKLKKSNILKRECENNIKRITEIFEEVAKGEIKVIG